jgi:hypothetical protein
MLLTGSRSHMNPFGMTRHVGSFSMTVANVAVSEWAIWLCRLLRRH